MEYILEENKLKLRINRIIGQLRGIERMIGTKRDCREVLQQISAIKKAIDSISKEIVLRDISKQIPRENLKKIEELVDRVVSM